jgi:hypothetical protein
VHVVIVIVVFAVVPFWEYVTELVVKTRVGEPEPIFVTMKVVPCAQPEGSVIVGELVYGIVPEV